MKLRNFQSFLVAVAALAAVGYAVAQTHTTGHESRQERKSRSSSWQSRGYRQTRSTPSAKPPGPEDYQDFSGFIAVRNIFNPDRYPYVSGGQPIRQPVVINHSAPGFSFVGTMSYGKGVFAFFDGNDDDYRKSLQTSGTIAGFTVREITQGHVVLAEGSNTVTLAVGAGLRKARDGSWAETDDVDFSSGTAGAGGSSGGGAGGDNNAAAAAPAAPVGEMSDVLKKLMKQREMENK